MDIETLLRTFDVDAADTVRAAIAEFAEAGGSDAMTVQAALRDDWPIAIRYIRSMSTGLATFQLEYVEEDGGGWQIHTRVVPWSGVTGFICERADRTDNEGTAWRIRADSPAVDVSFHSEEEARRFAAPALDRARDE